jgi:hypothetical protein
VAKRKSSKRSRSRRPTSQRSEGEAAIAQEAGAETASGTGVATTERPAATRPGSSRTRPARANARDRDPDGRPHAPWHPLPLAELLILVGVVGVMVAVFLQKVVSAPLLVASIAAVAIGTFEVTLREHLGGYRSHTVLLAVVPVVVLHSAVLLIAGAFTSVPRWVNIPLLAIDIAIFSLLYKLLRLRYLDAKRERRFAR